jgi:hypothetical protein
LVLLWEEGRRGGEGVFIEGERGSESGPYSGRESGTSFEDAMSSSSWYFGIAGSLIGLPS